MRFGITMFMTDETMGPVDLARAAEERGFSSLYIPEHTHIPASRRTPSPTGGEDLAEEYRRTLDPFVALAAAAACTERITLGTGVCVLAQHEPIVTAKAIATLDMLSRGRFVLGIGFGWNVEEMEDHGIDVRRRRELVREHVLAMRALWADDVASFDGEFVRFEPSWSWPKPVQRPGPPVLIGGAAGPKLFAAIADYADGWIPIGGGGVRAALPELRRRAEAAGRDPSTLRVVPFGVLPDPGKLDYYASLGIEEVVLRIPAGSAGEVLPVLDAHAKLVAS
ncbi:MAG: LLM class F420-dependent oxidoreductase [Actinobacteria bacterium]|nr:LLM class F420-dependent oxidoreductase [Actinomycetota bacterium]